MRQPCQYQVADFAAAVGCRPVAICAVEQTHDLGHEERAWHLDHRRDADHLARTQPSVRSQAMVRYLILKDLNPQAVFEAVLETTFCLVFGDYVLRFWKQRGESIELHESYVGVVRIIDAENTG